MPIHPCRTMPRDGGPMGGAISCERGGSVHHVEANEASRGLCGYLGSKGT